MLIYMELGEKKTDKSAYKSPWYHADVLRQIQDWATIAQLFTHEPKALTNFSATHFCLLFGTFWNLI